MDRVLYLSYSRTDGLGLARRFAAETHGWGVHGWPEALHMHLNEEATPLVAEWWTPDGGLRTAGRE